MWVGIADKGNKATLSDESEALGQRWGDADRLICSEIFVLNSSSQNFSRLVSITGIRHKCI